MVSESAPLRKKAHISLALPFLYGELSYFKAFKRIPILFVEAIFRSPILFKAFFRISYDFLRLFKGFLSFSRPTLSFLRHFLRVLSFL